MDTIYNFTTPLSYREPFYAAVQEENETIQDYLLRLKHLAITCEFGGSFNEAVRDKFVMGLRDREIKDILLFTKDLTLEQAENIAIASEKRNSTSSRNLAPSSNNALVSTYTSMPGISQDMYAVENSSNGCTQDVKSPEQCLIYPLISMPVTKTQDDEIGIVGSTIVKTQACRISTPNSQLMGSSLQDTPSTSYAENTYIAKTEQSPTNHESAISPIKTLDGKNLFPCPYCSKSYPYKSRLKQHKLKHSSEKKFPCRYCKKKLKNQGSKSNHEGICKANPNIVKPINVKKGERQE